MGPLFFRGILTGGFREVLTLGSSEISRLICHCAASLLGSMVGHAHNRRRPKTNYHREPLASMAVGIDVYSRGSICDH